jgi:hypothetical protein
MLVVMYMGFFPMAAKGILRRTAIVKDLVDQVFL